jgi:hypothetical protein
MSGFETYLMLWYPKQHYAYGVCIQYPFFYSNIQFFYRDLGTIVVLAPNQLLALQYTI